MLSWIFFELDMIMNPSSQYKEVKLFVYLIHNSRFSAILSSKWHYKAICVLNMIEAISRPLIHLNFLFIYTGNR